MSFQHTFNQIAQKHTILESSNFPAGQKKILLTFDDGPNPEVTPQLLKILAQHQAKAQFCFIGAQLERHPQLGRRVLNEGHQIVIHSYAHEARLLFNYRKLKLDTENFEQLYQNLSSESLPQLTHFRPPYGLKTPAVNRLLREKKLHSAYLTLLADDVPITPRKAPKFLAQLLQKLEQAQGGALLLHEQCALGKKHFLAYDKSWLPEAVNELLLWSKQKGYTSTATYLDSLTKF